MKLLSKAPVAPPSRLSSFDPKSAAVSGLTALAVMGAVTAASAVVSAVRSKGDDG